jgi:hypothetical protein
MNNGNGKLLFWLLGLLGTLSTGAAGGWLTTTHTLTRIHGEKIAVLESQSAEQRHQLERIEGKLDRLLDREKEQR